MDTPVDTSSLIAMDENNSPSFETTPYDNKSPQAADITIDGSPSTPKRKKAGRQAADNSEETRSRHVALYLHYKNNPHLSQSKLAEWFSTTYDATMSQCSVSQILKKQKLANGEPVEDPKPRPGKRKHLKDEESESNKKGRRSMDSQSIIGTPNGQQITSTTMVSYPTPSSERSRGTAGFQAVNSSQTPVTFSHYSNPTILAQSTPNAGSHEGHMNSRVDMARSGASPDTTQGVHAKAVPSAISRPNASSYQFPHTPQQLISRRTSLLPSKGVHGAVTEELYSTIEESLAMPGQASTLAAPTVAQLQSELNASRMTVNEYMKIVQKQESLIDNVLKNQHEDRERLRTLEQQNDKFRTENEMLKHGASDVQLKELLESVRNLTRSLEKEREKSSKLADLFNDEENAFKDIIKKRSTKFPLGLGDQR